MREARDILLAGVLKLGPHLKHNKPPHHRVTIRDWQVIDVSQHYVREYKARPYTVMHSMKYPIHFTVAAMTVASTEAS